MGNNTDPTGEIDDVPRVSEEEDEFVRQMYEGHDVLPFSEHELDQEDNRKDPQQWVDGDDMVGLVDEAEGGIVGYIGRKHSERIIALLNLAVAGQRDRWGLACAEEIQSLEGLDQDEAIAAVQDWLAENDHVGRDPAQTAEEILCAGEEDEE